MPNRSRRQIGSELLIFQRDGINMRTIFVIGLVLICAFMAGWFTVNRDDGETTIRINRDEIRSDTRAAINRGREFLDERGQRVAPPEGQYVQDEYGAQQPVQYQTQYQPQYQNQGQTQALPTGYRPTDQGQPYSNQPVQNSNSAGQRESYYYPNDPNATRPLAPWEQAPQSYQPQQGRQF